MSTFLSIRQASIQDLIQAAQALKAKSVEQNLLRNPEKVFPQLNAEKACYAYAVLEKFGGKRDLTEAEKQTVSEIANAYKDGFRTILAELFEFDATLRAARNSERWQDKSFFEYSKALVKGHDGQTYRLAISRKEIKNVEGLVTSLCFVPYNAVAQEQVSTTSVSPVGVVSAPTEPVTSYDAIEQVAL